MHVFPYLLFGGGSPTLMLVEGRELSKANWDLGRGLTVGYNTQ